MDSTAMETTRTCVFLKDVNEPSLDMDFPDDGTYLIT
jgi:hypothetical protein